MREEAEGVHAASARLGSLDERAKRGCASAPRGTRGRRDRSQLWEIEREQGAGPGGRRSALQTGTGVRGPSSCISGARSPVLGTARLEVPGGEGRTRGPGAGKGSL